MIFEMGILSARKVGILLAFVWIGALCYFLLPDEVPDFLNLKTKSNSKGLRFLTNNNNASKLEDKFGSEEKVHVCITSDENTLGGMIALINSIVTNTKSPVKFHLVVDSESMDHLGIWLAETKLKDIDFEVKAFPNEWVKGKIKVRGGREELGSPLNYARYYLPKLFPKLKKRIIFIDDDCIVQGDIKQLYDMRIKSQDLAAFSEDCSGINKRLSRLSNVYADFIDFKNKHIHDAHIKPGACSFNTGVFVTDLADWHKHNITGQLEYWMELNTREEVYGNEKGGGGSQPPMMIVFYDKYTAMDPMWHVRYLGWTAGTSYSKSFIQKANLLHWNGKFKPWGRTSQHREVWDSYFIPDPRGKFRPIRRN